MNKIFKCLSALLLTISSQFVMADCEWDITKFQLSPYGNATLGAYVRVDYVDEDDNTGGYNACSITNTLNGVSPTVCKIYLDMMIAAKTSGKTFVLE